MFSRSFLFFFVVGAAASDDQYDSNTWIQSHAGLQRTTSLDASRKNGMSQQHGMDMGGSENNPIRSTHHGRAVVLKRFPKYQYQPALKASKAQCQLYRDAQPMAGDWAGFTGNWWNLPNGCQVYSDGVDPRYYQTYTRVIWNNWGHDTDFGSVSYCDETKSERVGWDWDNGYNSCYNYAKLPGGLFGLQACQEASNEYFIEVNTKAKVWSVTGRINFPCSLWTGCAPSGGALFVTRTMFTAKSKNSQSAGGLKGPFDISGSLGFYVSMKAPAKHWLGGVDVSLGPFGSMTVSCFGGALSASGTIAGNFHFYNMKFSPFSLGTFSWTLSVACKVQIAVAVYQITLTMDSDGGWTANVPIQQILAGVGQGISTGIATAGGHAQKALGIEAAKPSKAMRKRGR